MRYCGIFSIKMFWVFILVVTLVLLILFSTWDKTTKVRNTKANRGRVSIGEKTGTNVTNEKEKSNANKPRLNVIILTHMSSGSTFLGNLFNLHPDVFYIYEPLHDLRIVVHGDPKDLGEWNVLNKKAEEVYWTDFFNLLRNIFTCDFQEDKTIDNVFPNWLRREKNYLAWTNTDTPFTKGLVRKACKSRKITVMKIMQTRLPGEIGIRELQRVCSSEPNNFECLIIHLVRDPRAVTSSLIGYKFHMPDGPSRKLVTTKNTSLEGKEMIMHNSEFLCSLVEDNLYYVNKKWSNWFSGRYILVRYEDTTTDLFDTVLQVYNFTGLRMVTSINNWIREGIRPPGVENSGPAFNISKSDVKRIEKWRFRLDTSQVSEFEEACRPLMYMMGYIPIDADERLLHNTSKKLWTNKMPYPFPR